MSGTRAPQVLVSSHMNPSLSGVARFNRELAQRLGVRCLGISERPAVERGPVLLSVKLEDCLKGDLERLDELLSDWRSRGVPFDVFFHTYSGLPVEERCVELGDAVYTGNAEIAARLLGRGKTVIPALCPPLLPREKRVHEDELNVFSFGMAHKLQLDRYLALHELLEKAGRSYVLWVSTAFHEKAEFGDFDNVSEELRGVMGPQVQFLGFLSDAAVNYFLAKAHLFVSFFPKGVRANNTSVAAAMALGCPVLTNTDAHSPRFLEHGKNVLDIARVSPQQLEPASLRRIGECGAAAARQHWDWASLFAVLHARGAS